MTDSHRQHQMLAKKISQILSQREKQTIVLSNVSLSPAAVLLPIYEKEGKYYILLTKRTQKVEHHKGQFCFPGGVRHKRDRDLMDTALRETFEEIGVRPKDVEILGELDSMGTLTSNFLITPFVGIIPHPYEFIINRDEIEELVEVPLSVLADEKNYREQIYVIDGVPNMGSVFEYNGRVIWGATARILKQFLDLVFSDLSNSSTSSP